MAERESSGHKQDKTSLSKSNYAIDVKCPHCGSKEMELLYSRFFLVVCVKCSRLVRADRAMEEYDLSALWGDE